MSKCKKVGIKIEVEVTGYQLTLTQDEAQLLMDIVGRKVVGSQHSSRRQHADTLYDALKAAGLHCTDCTDIHGQLACQIA